jgi:ketosteroid isomerase-like protein
MSSRELNIETTRAAFDAFQRGDAEAVLALARPDIDIYMPPPFPNAGSYRGREGYLEWTGLWLDVWEKFAIELTAMMPVGRSHIVADAHQQGVGRGSGIAVEQDVAYMTEVREGRIAALHLYLSHDDAVSAAERRESVARHE